MLLRSGNTRVTSWNSQDFACLVVTQGVWRPLRSLGTAYVPSIGRLRAIIADPEIVYEPGRSISPQLAPADALPSSPSVRSLSQSSPPNEPLQARRRTGSSRRAWRDRSGRLVQRTDGQCRRMREQLRSGAHPALFPEGIGRRRGASVVPAHFLRHRPDAPSWSTE
jgi:hypothetical protein